MNEVNETWAPVFLFLVAIALIFVYHWVLEGIAYQAMARRRGLRHRWLVWLPVGRDWVQGSLSDQYQYLVRGRIQSKRKVLLGISLGMLVLWAGVIGIYLWLVSKLLQYTSNIILWEKFGIPALMQCTAELTLLASFWLLRYPVRLMRAIFRTIALYDVYASCMPGSQATYLVLSLIFPVTRPIFLMSCRKKGLQYP